MMQVLWEFEVAEGEIAAFERAYGAHGEWVRLFADGDGYRGTSLLRDSAKAGRYVTVDRWDSRAQYEGFRAEHNEEYAAIDAQCEALTRAERLIGYFEET